MPSAGWATSALSCAAVKCRIFGSASSATPNRVADTLSSPASPIESRYAAVLIVAPLSGWGIASSPVPHFPPHAPLTVCAAVQSQQHLSPALNPNRAVATYDA